MRCGTMRTACSAVSMMVGNISTARATPPAMAELSATHTAAAGPSHAPTAASSLTSPAPIPPRAKIGKKNAAPTTQPASDMPAPFQPAT